MPGGTQLRCAARMRAASGGLKNGLARKIGAKKTDFGEKIGA